MMPKSAQRFSGDIMLRFQEPITPSGVIFGMMPKSAQRFSGDIMLRL